MVIERKIDGKTHKITLTDEELQLASTLCRQEDDTTFVRENLERCVRTMGQEQYLHKLQADVVINEIAVGYRHAEDVYGLDAEESLRHSVETAINRINNRTSR